MNTFAKFGVAAAVVVVAALMSPLIYLFFAWLGRRRRRAATRRRERQRFVQSDRIGDGLVDQRRQARHAEFVEHAVHVISTRTDVPRFEAIVEQRGERGWFCDAVDVIRPSAHHHVPVS